MTFCLGVVGVFPNEMAVSGLPSQALRPRILLPSVAPLLLSSSSAPTWVKCPAGWGGGAERVVEPRVLEEVTVCRLAVRPVLGVVAPPSHLLAHAPLVLPPSMGARCWSVHHSRGKHWAALRPTGAPCRAWPGVRPSGVGAAATEAACPVSGGAQASA